MNNRHHLLAAATLLLCTAAAVRAGDNGINVRGNATLMVQPDAAGMTFLIQHDAGSAVAATRAVAATMEKLLRVAREHGVVAADLETSGTTVHENRRHRDDGCSPPPLRARQTLRATLRELDGFDRFVDAAVAAGAWIQGDPELLVDDHEAHAEKALALAVDQAREQARTIAEQLGLTLGQAVRVQFSAPHRVRAAAFTSANLGGAVGTYPPEQVRISQSVNVQFDSLSLAPPAAH